MRETLSAYSFYFNQMNDEKSINEKNRIQLLKKNIWKNSLLGQ